jgi:hypothetical protein
MSDFNPFLKKSSSLGNLNTTQPQQNQSNKKLISTNFKIKPSIFIIFVVAILLTGYLFYQSSKINKPAADNNAVKVGTKADQITIMKHTSIMFLTHYLNLNYTVFKEERTKAESYMTPDQLAEYKPAYYNNEFVNKIIMSQFVTAYYYNSVLPVTMEDDNGNAWPAIQIIGVTKYTSMIKNIILECPFKATLGFVKDAEGNYTKIDMIKFE